MHQQFFVTGTIFRETVTATLTGIMERKERQALAVKEKNILKFQSDE